MKPNPVPHRALVVTLIVEDGAAEETRVDEVRIDVVLCLAAQDDGLDEQVPKTELQPVPQ